jgi:hypothetical protein
VTGTSPAPWSVNSSGGATTIVSRDRSVLAVIVGGGDAAPFEAGNAALMAQAPELQELLTQATDLMPIDNEVRQTWMRQVNLALAKAEAGR